MHDETIEQRKNKQELIPTPILDYDAYRADWADLELTAEQENELLSILWNIMRTMCDLSLEMDAVQMIMPTLLHSAFSGETDDKSGKVEQFNQSANGQHNTRSKSNG